MVSWLPFVAQSAAGPALRAWLTHPGSLTARLRMQYPALSVVVLRQRTARPYADEHALLGLRPGERAWVRDVLLCDGEKPLIYAHSVLPLHHARGAWHVFAGLGARPLGDVLFHSPSIQRGSLAFRRIDVRHPLFRAIQRGHPRALPASLWARRSLFTRHQRALLVSEVFLPALFDIRHD